MISSFAEKYIVSLFKKKNRKECLYSQVEIYPDDIFLVSYPKSGNTWLRFLIGNYLTGNGCDFENSHFIVPDIHYNPEQCIDIKRPRFIKSHFPFSYSFNTNKYPNVVYLVRDGRDVSVSYFFYLKKIRKIDIEMPFDEYLLMFNQGIIDRFSNWSFHVNFWLDYATCNMMIVRYEDMRNSTVETLERILSFSGIIVDRERVIKAVEVSRFENMRNQEKNSRFMKDDMYIPFVRSGEVGRWNDFFTDILYKDFLNIHGSVLARLNYL